MINDCKEDGSYTDSIVDLRTGLIFEYDEYGFEEVTELPPQSTTTEASRETESSEAFDWDNFWNWRK